MDKTNEVFDELFTRTLDCVTELRNREMSARTALEAANIKIARYETALSDAPESVRRNAELLAEVEIARREIVELRAQLGAIRSRKQATPRRRVMCRRPSGPDGIQL